MPRITIKTNMTMPETMKASITSQMQTAICMIPREQGAFLMIDYEDNHAIYFGEDMKQPCASVEVNVLQSVYDEVDQGTKEAFLAKASAIICNTCGIPDNRIFVFFRNSQMWAAEGINIERTLLKR